MALRVDGSEIWGLAFRPSARRAGDSSLGLGHGRTRRPAVPSPIDVTGLKYVIEVAGSFAKAGVRLGLNSSTLTRRISSIEDALGITLFERTRSGVRITRSARAVIAQIRRAIGEFDAVTDVANRNGGGRAGEIRLGFRIPPVAELFLMLSLNGVCVTGRWR
jgi:hypothetical protein